MKARKYLTLCSVIIALTLSACSSTGTAETSVESSSAVSESSQEETISTTTEQTSADDKIGDLKAQNVVLSDDEEIESEGWIDAGDKCYRVGICYKEQPEEGYQHKRDYFFCFMDEDTQVLEVDYPPHDALDDAERLVGSACDFNAHLEDVNFDGKEDLIIFLGHAGAHGVQYSCAYLCTDEGYEYCKSFERIPNYSVDTENQVVAGQLTSSARSISKVQYVYDEAAKEFVKTSEKDYEYDEELGDFVEI